MWLLLVVVLICLAPAVAMFVVLQFITASQVSILPVLDAFALLLLLLSLRYMPVPVITLFVVLVLFNNLQFNHLSLRILASTAGGMWGVSATFLLAKLMLTRADDIGPDRNRIVTSIGGLVAGVGALIIVALTLPRPVLPELVVMYGMPATGALLMFMLSVYYLLLNREAGSAVQQASTVIFRVGPKLKVFVGVLLGVVAYVLLSIDTIRFAGDHVSNVVWAPYPTLAFSHGGGEEGASSVEALPEWYLSGQYVFLYEQY